MCGFGKTTNDKGCATKTIINMFTNFAPRKYLSFYFDNDSSIHFLKILFLESLVSRGMDVPTEDISIELEDRQEEEFKYNCR